MSTGKPSALGPFPNTTALGLRWWGERVQFGLSRFAGNIGRWFAVSSALRRIGMSGKTSCRSHSFWIPCFMLSSCGSVNRAEGGPDDEKEALRSIQWSSSNLSPPPGSFFLFSQGWRRSAAARIPALLQVEENGVT